MRPNLQEIFKHSFKNQDGNFRNELTTQDIQLIWDNQLFKCFLPEKLGGLSLDIFDTLAIIEEASFINGSLGWLIQIGNGGNYFVTNFDTETASHFFKPNDSVIAGSGTPTAVAKKTNGGYLVSGRWKYCSGSAYATLFTVTFQLDETNEVCSAIVPRAQVQIHNDWQTIGLKNTSTNTIELTEVFIPELNLFHVNTRKSHFEEAIFDLPFLVYAQAFFLQVVFGTYRRMLNEAKDQLEVAAVYLARHETKKASIEQLIQSGELLLKEAKTYLTQIIQQLLDKKELNLIVAQQQLIQYGQQLKNAAHQLFTSRGIEALYSDNPFTTAYLDLISVSQHKLLNEIISE